MSMNFVQISDVCGRRLVSWGHRPRGFVLRVAVRSLLWLVVFAGSVAPLSMLACGKTAGRSLVGSWRSVPDPRGPESDIVNIKISFTSSGTFAESVRGVRNDRLLDRDVTGTWRWQGNQLVTRCVAGAQRPGGRRETMEYTAYSLVQWQSNDEFVLSEAGKKMGAHVCLVRSK